MLTKRTHILFNEELWGKLVSLAKRQQTSAGNIIRSAVREKLDNEEQLAKRKAAIDAILKVRKVSKGKIDYKALINDGRKY